MVQILGFGSLPPLSSEWQAKAASGKAAASLAAASESDVAVLAPEDFAERRVLGISEARCGGGGGGVWASGFSMVLWGRFAPVEVLQGRQLEHVHADPFGLGLLQGDLHPTSSVLGAVPILGDTNEARFRSVRSEPLQCCSCGWSYSDCFVPRARQEVAAEGQEAMEDFLEAARGVGKFLRKQFRTMLTFFSQL